MPERAKDRRPSAGRGFLKPGSLRCPTVCKLAPLTILLPLGSVHTHYSLNPLAALSRLRDILFSFPACCMMIRGTCSLTACSTVQSCTAIVAHGCSGNHRDVNNALRGIVFLPAFLISLIGCNAILSSWQVWSSGLSAIRVVLRAAMSFH